MIDCFDTKEQFDEHGFAGPFSLADHARMEDFRVDDPAPHHRAGGIIGWHMNSPGLQGVLRDINFRDRMTTLCGPNLVIWRSGFFHKQQAATEIGWHHDKHFQGAENEPLDFDEISTHFSVLLALDDMAMDNGRLELIPGSHRNLAGYDRDCRPFYEKTKLEEHFVSDIPPEILARRQSVILEEGAFLVFHSGLLHRSLSYSNGNERSSFALRLVPSTVTVPAALQPYYLAIS